MCAVVVAVVIVVKRRRGKTYIQNILWTMKLKCVLVECESNWRQGRDLAAVKHIHVLEGGMN